VTKWPIFTLFFPPLGFDFHLIRGLRATSDSWLLIARRLIRKAYVIWSRVGIPTVLTLLDLYEQNGTNDELAVLLVAETLITAFYRQQLNEFHEFFMFSDPNLDTPPPQSQFRRPWSPEPYDPYPSSSTTFNRLQNVHYEEQDQPQERNFHRPSSHGQRRREASEVSVEALDLADYARTLRVRQAEDPYPPFPSQITQPNSHPPSSFPALLPLVQSRSSLAQPPSLVSRGPTLSSNSTHHTSSSGRQPGRRPFSMPVTPLPSSHASSSRHRGPYIVEAEPHPTPSEEIDISRFPRWSRNWYNPNTVSTYPTNPIQDPADDIYSPLPVSHLNGTRSNKKSPFDPGYVHGPYNSNNSYDLPPPLSSLGHDSVRDMVPWSNDPPEYGPPLDPMLKEERMRMLEREFGSKGKGKSKSDGLALVDDEGKPLVGTVDPKGYLVTTGPKRRVFVRTLQIILAAGASVPAIYAAVVSHLSLTQSHSFLNISQAIKPENPKDPPPPANKPPIFVLYILSSLTLLLLLFMFFVRPCCCARSKSQSSKHPLGGAANMGMMVLPVGGPGKKNKKPKGGNKGKGKYGRPGAQGDVQVNLIVDPTAFQPPEASDSDSEDDYDSLDEAMMPGGLRYDGRQQARRKKRNRNRRRRGVFEGLAMEEDWRAARSWAKKVAMVDAVGIVLWGAAFVFIITGKKCPSGGYNGWFV
jgi:hypothetical protein